AELRLLLNHVRGGDLSPEAARRALTALGDAGRLRSVLPSGEATDLRPLLQSSNPELQTAAIQVAGAWKLAAVTSDLVQLAGAANTSTAVRTAAFAALRDIGGAGGIAELKALAGS